MNAKVFSDAMGVIDNSYIEEAAFYRKVRKSIPWAKLAAAAACLLLAVAITIPILNRQDHSSVTENEPRIELTLKEAMNDKTFGMLFPTQILEGYVLEDSPGIYGVSDYAELETTDSVVLAALFYNEEFGDEMRVRIASKEWFHSHEEDSFELNTIHYREYLSGVGSYIYFEGGDNIICYSFTARDIAQIEGFGDMVNSAEQITGYDGEYTPQKTPSPNPNGTIEREDEPGEYPKNEIVPGFDLDEPKDVERTKAENTFAVVSSIRSRVENDPHNTAGRDNFYEVIMKEKVAESDKRALNIPVYYEEDLLFKTDGKFYLNRDFCFYENQNAHMTYTGGIMEAYPDPAIREREYGSLYFIYDTDTGYRLFLFFTYENDLQDPIGFPVVIKELLSYNDFSGLKIGDPIEDVEAIDSVATLHKKLIIDVWNLDPVGAAGHAKDGYPCTSIHYLSDGILKIEYEMLEGQKLVISNMVFNENYVLENARGKDINYKINEIDLPTR